MKILFLTDKLCLGGAESHIFDLMQELRKRGHTVELGCDSGEGWERFLHSQMTLHHLPFCTNTVIAGINLYRLLKRGNYDIVHSHARRPAFFAEPLCRMLRIPFVTTAHWVFRADGWRGRFSRWGNATFAVSEDIADYLKTAYGLGRERITILPNGVDIARFTAPVCRETGKILHISRLDSDRADMAKALLCIAPKLAKHAESLTVVGGGDCYEMLKEQADRVNCQLGRRFVHMTGAQEDVLPYLRESDIFVGVSRAALEAMACGLAVVLGGNEGYFGRLMTEEERRRATLGNFCCRDGGAIEKERLLYDICAFLQDPATARKTGDENRRYVEVHHSAADMANRALEVYRRFVPPKKQPLRALLAGYCGFGNLGDDAILWGLISSLREAGITDIAVLSQDAKKSARTFGVCCISRSDSYGIEKALTEADIFILGGGNLLQNETSNRSLYYYTQLLFRAKRAGCYTVLRGGIGKLTGRWAHRRTARALCACDMLFLRTPNDVKRAAFLLRGKRPPTFLVPDEVFFMPKGEDVSLSFSLAKGKLLLLCVRGNTPDSQGIRETAELCQVLQRKYGLQTAVYAMHPDADTVTARTCANAISGAALLPALSPTEFLALSECCALIISARLHPLIFAARCKTPAIGFSDSGKTDDFFDFMQDAAPSLPLTRLPLGWNTALAGGVLMRAAESLLDGAAAKDKNLHFSLSDFVELSTYL